MDLLQREQVPRQFFADGGQAEPHAEVIVQHRGHLLEIVRAVIVDILF